VTFLENFRGTGMILARYWHDTGTILARYLPEKRQTIVTEWKPGTELHAKYVISLGLIDPEEAGTTTHRNVGMFSPKDTPPHPRRLKC